MYMYVYIYNWPHQQLSIGTCVQPCFSAISVGDDPTPVMFAMTPWYKLGMIGMIQLNVKIRDQCDQEN